VGDSGETLEITNLRKYKGLGQALSSSTDRDVFRDGHTLIQPNINNYVRARLADGLCAMPKAAEGLP